MFRSSDHLCVKAGYRTCPPNDERDGLPRQAIRGAAEDVLFATSCERQEDNGFQQNADYAVIIILQRFLACEIFLSLNSSKGLYLPVHCPLVLDPWKLFCRLKCLCGLESLDDIVAFHSHFFQDRLHPNVYIFLLLCHIPRY